MLAVGEVPVRGSLKFESILSRLRPASVLKPPGTTSLTASFTLTATDFTREYSLFKLSGSAEADGGESSRNDVSPVVDDTVV